jgi:hypothetical protein
MDRKRLEEVRAWAHAKLATGEEPPWAWYQYMKLRETLDAILAGMDAVTPPSRQDSPQSELRSDEYLRLVADNDQQDTAQSRADQTPAVPMPM